MATHPEVRVELGSAGCRPGDQLTGRAVWRAVEAPEAVELRLFWYTSGKGDRDSLIVDEQRFDSPGAFGNQEFSFKLPAEPYSFSGRLISLVWAVEVVLISGGEAGRAEFALGPEGREVQLESAA